MLIIVEGCDGVGKSTFVRSLVDTISEPVDVLHRGVPKRHPLQEYERDIEVYRSGEGRHIICDRWHWGELIYGPMFRGESKLGLAGWYHIELFLKARGALTVHLTHDADTALGRVMARGDDYVPADKRTISRLLQEYAGRSFSTLTETRTVTDPGDTEVLSAVLQAQLLEEETTRLSKYKSLIGAPTPSYLILGEKKGSLHLGDHDAAFVPYSSTSGRFLLEALPREILEDCAIANALEEDVAKLWSDLERPAVIALGYKARRACQEAAIPHTYEYHPQYVRRFAHSKQAAYGQMIASKLRRERNAHARL